MDFVIDFQGRVGLREKGKWWKVIDNHTCFISDERIESLFRMAREWVGASGLSFFDRKSHVGFLRYIVIRATRAGETMMNLITSAPSPAEDVERLQDSLRALAAKTEVTTLLWSVNHTVTDISFAEDTRVISGPGSIVETIGGTNYRISPHAFFQTNSHASPILLDTVSQFVGDLSGKLLLDLYCGSGFFSVALGGKAARTVGVEILPEAIVDAKHNATANGRSVEFFAEKTEAFNWVSLGADVVILDPPRSGMHDKALQDVLRAKPKTIVYVSCNPKHFAREMVEMQNLYSVSAMRAIDMFPHTPHVELVTRLDLR